MRNHPRAHFSQVPLKKIQHLIAQKDPAVKIRKITREKITKSEPYNDPAQSSAPARLWGSFHP